MRIHCTGEVIRIVRMIHHNRSPQMKRSKALKLAGLVALSVSVSTVNAQNVTPRAGMEQHREELMKPFPVFDAQTMRFDRESASRRGFRIKWQFYLDDSDIGGGF
jgi:hypothetical protein